MPKYRQLHTKMVDSYDIAAMPDDFTRFFYLTLIIVLDSAGRAIDNPAWLRSKAFPLREDVTIEQISKAMDHFEEKKLIIRYKVNGNGYFYCPSFLALQTGLENEMKSTLPGPTPELLPSKSEPTPKSVGSKSPPIQCNAINNTRQDKTKQGVESEKVTPSFSEKEHQNYQSAISQLYSSGKVSKSDFEAWVQPLELIAVADGVYTVKAANGYQRNWILPRLPALNSLLKAQVEVTL